MAIVCSTRFMKCSPRLICLSFANFIRKNNFIKPGPFKIKYTFFRPIKKRLLNQGSAQFSNSLVLSAKDSGPVKYTTNTAAGVRIAQTIGLENQEANTFSRYARLMISASLAVFLIYFCILREENDLDELLKGNPEFVDETYQLLDLKMKLKFCEQNNLPRDALRVKIEEIESRKQHVSPFIK